MYVVEKTRGINFVRQFDYLLFGAVLILSIIGMFVLSSATLTRSDFQRLMMVQAIGLLIGVVLALVISLIDYKDFKNLGIIFYAASSFLLLFVLKFGSGKEELGSNSWIELGGISIQPAELAKITFVIVISIFLERIKDGNTDQKNFIKLGIYSAIPIALVLAQHDFGTTLVFIFMFFVMIFICGIPYKYIFGMIGTFIASLPLFWFFVLNDKRKERILVFLDPSRDPKGSGFNVIQSQTAIGSGQLYGKGLYQGIQTQNAAVPVKESDFIFSVIGEELGFIGAVIVIALILIILLRCMYIARNSRDSYGSFIVIGLTAMMGFHFIENIGMSIGLLPVTGIPLPFLSQGGTAMISNYIAIGLILSVSIRRERAIFNNP